MMERLKDIQQGFDFRKPLDSRPTDNGNDGLTDEEMRIWGILQEHQGRDRAVLGPVISEETGIEYIRVREIISHLIKQHGCLIASSSRGYFVPITADEIDTATKSLERRGISILVRAAKLKKTSLEKIFQQARIEYEKENSKEKSG